MTKRRPISLTTLLLFGCVVGLSGGGVAWLAGRHGLGDVLWAGTAGLALIPITAELVRRLRQRSAGVDVIAILAIIGALILGEYLAGSVIGLMIATGRALEEYAANRAERELSSLLERAPRLAHRVRNGAVDTVSVEEVLVGETLLVKEGDILPVDGVVSAGPALLDEAALTGESRLVERLVGDHVRSGTANAGGPFYIRATTTAADSTYAGIIRMVREAQGSKAPLVRLADRYAQFFVPVTLVVAGAAWVIAGNPGRALAVLVVATPCPLLLAAPVAIVSGVSRAARRGIIVKGGAAIETLARGRVLFLDKTGTITLGAPRLQRIVVSRLESDATELLRISASVDQMSSHVLATALVKAARDRGLILTLPTEVTEKAGLGVAGSVDGTAVRLGHFAWVCESTAPSSEQLKFRRRLMRDEGSIIFVSVGGKLAGAFVFDDSIRPDAPRVLRLLKRRGIEEIVMLTGDHVAVAEPVGAAIGVDRVMDGLAGRHLVLGGCRRRHGGRSPRSPPRGGRDRAAHPVDRHTERVGGYGLVARRDGGRDPGAPVTRRGRAGPGSHRRGRDSQLPSRPPRPPGRGETNPTGRSDRDPAKRTSRAHPARGRVSRSGRLPG